ncbi:DUF4837 family protein [Labilibaculum sp. DW002]|jgi:uncharacterized protein DUF4837|uniref:DUF4837 family protein n=1 Tax=Paralabilibaculum antarcticum TaxID=2912572 RepID=A0ABT5VVS7_9BACT|nr:MULTISPECIES: DUF4837 family protein [unclassified Labilibaculum]MBI9057716.1 DUF4837 family protein [Labilibaculum sp.]MDE5419355.1 DUF4837 family protein [Labilibaculum sp. DW002]
MKRIIQVVTLCLFVVASMSSCKKTTKGLRPVVTGKSGEVLVLINDALYEGSVGDSLKSVLNDTQIGLPQSEPLFDILHLSHNAFSSMFKTHRSILDIRVSSKVTESKISVKDAVYAKSQSFMKIEAKNNKEMIKMLTENRNKIIAYFHLGERNRKLKVFKKNTVQEVFDKLKAKYDFTLTFPSGYTINKEEGDFLWISKETPTTSQGMFIYTYDYISEDSFTKDAVVKKRNILLGNFVPGPLEGSYMTTEKGYPISNRYFEFMGNYASETRGLWKVENDFMGGPFLNITFLDKKNNKVVCLDSYVYYPNHNKRELLRELEAVMYSYNNIVEK